MRPTLAAAVIGLALGGGPQESGVAVLARALGAITPRLSPDGTAIAFSYQGSIWRVPREGGTARRLTAAASFDQDPAWSADGRRIAYLGNGLRLIDAETGAALKVPALPATGRFHFHPDGRLLGNFGQPAALAWLELGSGELKPVLPRAIPRFALSPDGARIAFVTTMDAPGEQSGHNGPQNDLWTVPSVGGEPNRLLRFRSRIFELAWGTNEIYFSSELGGAHNDLWSVSPDDPAHGHRLTNGGADEDAPSVSADNRWLVYTDNRAGATALVVRDLKSGAENPVAISRLDYGEPTGRIRIELSDRSGGGPPLARLSVQREGGRYFAPPGALYRILGTLEHFYASGREEFALPAGKYVVRAFRGLEYRPVQKEVEVPAGRSTVVRLDLERWAHPQASGWYGGESHIHANYGYGHWYNSPETMRLQVAGEGLNVANFVVANSDADGVFDREYFRGEPDPISTLDTVLYWNQEFRATLWGHMTLYNLKQLVEPIFTGFKDTTNPYDVPTNADIADHAHLQGGHVNYTHPAQNVADPLLTAYSAKEIPIDVALGKIDSLDINGSFEATVPLWHRLLNCGFRLPASAGTDCFLNRIRSRLPGGDRAYVKLEGDFSYDAWVKGLKAGRSFVTNGPMLEFEAGGKGLGGTIRLEGPAEIAVRGAATSPLALDRVELVRNGEVIAQSRSGRIEQAVRIERSGWLGLRAYAQSTQAHTSPIYVEVAGRPADSREDAKYFLAWIDRLEAKVRERDRLPSPALKARVELQLNGAREVYRRLAAGEGGK